MKQDLMCNESFCKAGFMQGRRMWHKTYLTDGLAMGIFEKRSRNPNRVRICCHSAGKLNLIQMLMHELQPVSEKTCAKAKVHTWNHASSDWRTCVDSADSVCTGLVTAFGAAGEESVANITSLPSTQCSSQKQFCTLLRASFEVQFLPCKCQPLLCAIPAPVADCKWTWVIIVETTKWQADMSICPISICQVTWRRECKFGWQQILPANIKAPCSPTYALFFLPSRIWSLV